jgi:hypothetical protein
MIITEKRAYPKIKKELNKKDKIGIISCNACANICNTGGEKQMKKLAKKLEKDGFNIVDMDLIGIPCDYSQLNKSQLHGDTQIVLACDSGIHNLKKLFPKHKIIPGLKTMGIGAHDHKGNVDLVREVK